MGDRVAIREEALHGTIVFEGTVNESISHLQQLIGRKQFVELLQTVTPHTIEGIRQWLKNANSGVCIQNLPHKVYWAVDANYQNTSKDKP